MLESLEDSANRLEGFTAWKKSGLQRAATKAHSSYFTKYKFEDFFFFWGGRLITTLANLSTITNVISPNVLALSGLE